MASEVHKDNTQISFGQQRKFLLVIGLKNGLLCLICHSQHPPQVAVSPDPLIVDKGRALLLRLEAKGVFSACERRYFMNCVTCKVNLAEISLFSKEVLLELL